MFKINKIFVHNSDFSKNRECHILTECSTEYGKFVLLTITERNKSFDDSHTYNNVRIVTRSNFEILADEISKWDKRLVNVEIKHADYVFFDETHQREPYDNIEEKTKKFVYSYIESVLKKINEDEEPPTDEDIDLMDMYYN